MEGIGYTYTNCFLMHIAHPTRFEVPTHQEMSRIRVGDFVKLVFLIQPPPAPHSHVPTAERMWVRVTRIENNTFHGTLASEPVFIDAAHGDEVTPFHTEHIASIYRD